MLIDSQIFQYQKLQQTFLIENQWKSYNAFHTICIPKWYFALLTNYNKSDLIGKIILQNEDNKD